MTAFRWISLALFTGMWTSAVAAQELQWRPVKTQQTTFTNGVSLGAPVPVSKMAHTTTADGQFQQTSFKKGMESPVYPDGMIIRAQSPSPGVPPVPPPAYPGAGGSALGEEDYNCGNVLTPGPGAKVGPGGFWGSVTTTTGGRRFLGSDNCFDTFISPVSNPLLFEDPRALTELRPIVMFQRVPGDNAVAPGANIYQFTLQGRLALTDWLTITINQLGYTAGEFDDGMGGTTSQSGFSEVHLGPKFTFFRKTDKGTFFGQTIMAAGVVFELPIGSSDVFQDTGTLSVRPYFSFGQSFWETSYGQFHFLASTGYSFAVDGDRSDHLFFSTHLDYDVGNIHRFYPFVELNYFMYTRDGNVRDLTFEGRDLFNFGSRNVSGNSELSVALGARFKFNEMFQIGAAFEMPIVGDQNFMEYRITADFIFRY